MNRPFHQFVLRAWILAALLAGILGTSLARAQQAVNSRYLLVFDTSSDMKKRVPAVQRALDNLFVTGMGEQLLTGDSIGVWTFDQKLRAGQFPLQYWVPDRAEQITANITSLVEKQYYSKTANFGALQPWLDDVVKNSQRLTVLIFCDGETAVSGTPYDNGINQIFKQRQAGQKKARQPFVIVLRAQEGKYVGCTVDFPPAQVVLPSFPPLPLPPPPPAPTNQPPPPPPSVVAPSIIVVGTSPPPSTPKPTNAPPPVVPINQTNVETNLPPPAPKSTNAPPSKLTNTPPVAPVNRTNMETNALPPVAAASRTNAMASPPENSSLGSGSTLAIGAVFLAAAAGLGIFIWRRSRKSGASLITRSMNKE